MTSARRRVVILAVVAVGVAASVALAIMLSSDDPESSTVSTSPATAQPTDIAGADTAPYDPINPPFQRPLQSSGMFDCVRPGQWQPFLDRPLVIAVGEPPEGSTCAQDVIDLPFKYCSVKACSQIPPDWDIRLQPGVPPDALFLLVAPTDATNARLYCYRKLIADPIKLGSVGTTIEQACPSSPPGNVSPSNSVDIPFVAPPVSDDLATVPPNVSTDIPKG